MRAIAGLLVFAIGCDSTVETQDGGAASADGAGGSQADLPEPETCEEFCGQIHSFGCGCSCNGQVGPAECLEVTKKVWSCFVENYIPKAPNGDGCGAPECFDLVVDEQECEEMY